MIYLFGVILRILITGATGFIGRNLSEAFSEEYELLCPSHKELELLDDEAVANYISKKDVEVIIHCANKGGSRDTIGLERVVEDNLRIFFNLARNSESIKRMIYFGSGAEFGKHRHLRKISETQFDTVIPKDDYGFYKYICNKHAEDSKNIINLRLFGVYGRYENYEYRFISNAIVKNLLGLDVTINQNVTFDFLYINDLVNIVRKFISKPKLMHRSYNLCPDDSIELCDLAQVVNRISKHTTKVKIINPGMNLEYTGDNKRLITEFPNASFTSYQDAITELFDYYQKILPKIDRARILADPYLVKCNKK